MPESGTRSPRSLTSAAHRSAPPGSSQSASLPLVCPPRVRPGHQRSHERGLESSDQTGGAERGREWNGSVGGGGGDELGWREGVGGGGPKTSKTTTITARKQTTRGGKNTPRREKGEGSKRSSEAPKVLQLIKTICIYL